jgi:hypothetical protein
LKLTTYNRLKSFPEGHTTQIFKIYLLSIKFLSPCRVNRVNPGKNSSTFILLTPEAYVDGTSIK